MQFPIDIALCRSRLLFVLTAFLHALAAASLFVLPLVVHEGNRELSTRVTLLCG